MELILRSDNEQSMEKIIVLAKELNVAVEKKLLNTHGDKKEALKEKILNFKATSSTSFGDAKKWQQEQREDRDLPFF